MSAPGQFSLIRSANHRHFEAENLDSIFREAKKCLQLHSLQEETHREGLVSYADLMTLQSHFVPDKL